jgi:hypothetical protein
VFAKTLLIVLMLLISPGPPAPRKVLASCKQIVPFSGLGARDELRVSIVGERCEESQITTEILSAGGKELYRYQANYPESVVDACSEPLADFTPCLNEPPYKRTSDLPDYPADPMDTLFTIMVSRADYERLRTADLMIVFHGSSREAWRMVVFDPLSSKAVVLVEGAT